MPSTKPNMRPKIVESVTHKIKTPCGTLYVTVGIIDKRIYEVFVRMGKAGLCYCCLMNTIARLISMSLQKEIPIDLIIKQLVNESCNKPIYGTHLKKGAIRSCADGIARILKMEKERCH